MKILIVSQFFYPESFRINHLAEALASRGHEITVLTGQPNYPHGQMYPGYSNTTRWRESHGSIKILRVPVYPRKNGRAFHLLLNYISFALSAAIFGLPRLSRPDVCLVWASSPITSALPAVWFRAVRGTPVAIWIQDLWPETFSAVTRIRSPFVLKPLRAIVKYIYRRCDQIWVQSKAFTSSIVAHGGASDKINYLPNWAEDFYDRDASAKVVPKKPELASDFSILFAGNLGQAQALSTAVAAAKKLGVGSRATWYFIGDGSMRMELENEIKRENLGERIKVLAPRPAKEMPALFRQAKVLFVSLTADPVFDLTVPSKIQSYLAAGQPVLASLNGEGARLIAESGCGLVSSAEDANGLAANVSELLNLSDSDLKKMGQRSYELYKAQFRSEVLIDQAERLLKTME